MQRGRTSPQTLLNATRLVAAKHELLVLSPFHHASLHDQLILIGLLDCFLRFRPLRLTIQASDPHVLRSRLEPLFNHEELSHLTISSAQTLKLIKRIKSSAALVFAGPKPLNLSPRYAIERPKQVLLTSLAMAKVARLSGTSVLALSISLAQPEGIATRPLLQMLLRQCDFVTVRDRFSAVNLTSLAGKRLRVWQAFDWALFATDRMPRKIHIDPAHRSRILIALDDPHWSPQSLLLQKARCLAGELTEIFRRIPKVEVHLLDEQHDNKDASWSELTIGYLRKNRLDNRLQVISHDHPVPVWEEVCQSRLVLTDRYEVAMLAFAAQTSLLMLQSHPELSYLALELQLPSEARIKPEDLSTQSSVARRCFECWTMPSQFIAGLQLTEAKKSGLLNMRLWRRARQIFSSA